MENKTSIFLTRIIAFAIIILTIYVIGIFLFPDIWDAYGNSDFHMQIREWKNASLHISSPDGSLNSPF